MATSPSFLETPFTNSSLSNWTEAYPTNETARRICVGFIFILALIGGTLCLVVLYVAVRAKAYRHAHDLLIMAAAAADFLRAVHGFATPFFYWSFLPKTDINDRLCKAYIWLHYFQYTVSAWSMAAIAFSRFDLIAHPMKMKLTIRGACSIIFLILVEAAVFASLPLWGWNRYGLLYILDPPDRFHCGFADRLLDIKHRSFVLVQYLLNYSVLFFLVLVFYSLIVPIAVKHRQRRRRRNCQLQDPNVESPRSRLSVNISDLVKSKPFAYITIIISSNIILTAPFIVVSIIQNFMQNPLGNIALPLTGLIFNLSFAINSFLYLMWVKTLRDGFSLYFCCKSQGHD
eukprot:m.81361 g.81361  ORF g.81361 m.81361 type:complete len:344 (+) comp36236_c0_seq2:509-1540(+)